MKFILPALAATFLTLSLAGCASPPPQQAVLYPDAPPRKPLDAKTQLETGRRY
ncbi:MAG: YgdI/YgdR family lipoprotein [Beijerinckiaceae bacterium]|jgi:hypothetical protein|nr:YgdI/YgdR family lipoprotein [Beijerinckiaceae bacterium]MDO9441709.1 hypothetical protein [Beijerinckiaceae bacterium]